MSHRPSLTDARMVRTYLIMGCLHALRNGIDPGRTLPNELIDDIMDEAEYWPHTSVSTGTRTLAHQYPWVAHGATDKEDIFIIRAIPLGAIPGQINTSTLPGFIDGFTLTAPRPVIYPAPSASAKLATETLIDRWKITTPVRDSGSPCRKIIFTIQSQNINNSGELLYQEFIGWRTWFDVGLERVEACNSSEPTSNQHFLVTISNASGLSQSTPCILRTVRPALEEDGTLFHPRSPPNDHIIDNRMNCTNSNTIEWSRHDRISSDPLIEFILWRRGRGKASGDGQFVRNLKIGDVITV